MAGSLTLVQRNLLSEALLDGFRSPAALRLMIDLGTNEKLAQITTPGTLPDMVLEAIDYFEAAGEIDDLVTAAIQKRPRNSKLKAIAAQLGSAAPEVRGAYSLADPSTFDLTDLEDAFLLGKDDHPAQRLIACVVRYGEGMFLSAFTARIRSILGPGTQMREPITLNALFRTPDQVIKEIEGYTPALERMNLVSVIQADNAPSEHVQVVWTGVRQQPVGLQNYLVLLFTAAPSTEFPADIWELPSPRFDEAEVRRWTSMIARSQQWPDDDSRAWTNKIREKAWDEERQAYDLRVLYQYLRESLADMNHDQQAFRASLKERSD
jgi:Effector-associated domain 1